MELPKFALALMSVSVFLVPAPPFARGTAFFPAQAQANSPADTVVFNLKTHKMHARNCPWAFKCTRSCIKITRESALKKGGIPCKICHAEVD